MSDPIRIVVSDPETGEVFEDQILQDDYAIITAGNHYLHHVARHANGTTVLTVKVEPEKDEQEGLRLLRTPSGPLDDMTVRRRLLRTSDGAWREFLG